MNQLTLRTKFLPFQPGCIEEIEDFNGRCLLACEMGLGKAQPLHSKILTPKGWVTMGEVSTGDEIMSPNGKATRVIAVFPQGEKEVFSVHFSDGSCTESCGDHLWSVICPRRKHRGKPHRVVSLKQILEEGLTDNQGNRKHFIPLVQPLQLDERALPIPPYLLGYLLANGSLRHQIGVSIPDEETEERLKPYLPERLILRRSQSRPIDYGIVDRDGRKGKRTNPLKTLLCEMGLFGKGSHEKFIPDEYLFNSINNRLLLLQGLMDGDGYVSTKGDTIQYSSSSEALIKGVEFLIQSLGGTTRCAYDPHPSFIYKGERKTGRPHWTLTISLPPDQSPFLLSRKANRVKPKVKYLPHRSISSIESNGVHPCQCIKVENEDGLYVTDDCIVTHNTFMSLAYWQRHPEITRAVVVCPASALWTWEREARTHLGIRCEVLEGTFHEHRCPIKTKARLFIINYDILLRRKSRKKGGELETWVPFLKDLDPGLVVFDECHFLSGLNSQRTRASQELARGIKHVIALSGTPLTNRPADLWPVLNILRPDRWPNFYSFAHTHCQATYNKRYRSWEFKGATKIKLLHTNLKRYVLVRRRKADVLKDLPAKTKTVIPLSISNQKEYDRATVDFIGWLKKISPSKAARAKRNEAMSKVGYLIRLVADGKLKGVFEWIDNFLESDEKLLVFGIHEKVLSALEQRYQRICVKVDGKLTGRERQKAFDQFNKSDRTRLLFGNIDAAGTAWSCTSSSNVAFCELPWAPGKVEQGIDRCHGVGRGQKGIPTSAFFLVAHSTIEEKLCEVLQRKQKIITSTLDGKRVRNEMDIFEQLLKELEKESLHD